jgi:hypothetical protein
MFDATFTVKHAKIITANIENQLLKHRLETECFVLSITDQTNNNISRVGKAARGYVWYPAQGRAKLSRYNIFVYSHDWLLNLGRVVCILRFVSSLISDLQRYPTYEGSPFRGIPAGIP